MEISFSKQRAAQQKQQRREGLILSREFVFYRQNAAGRVDGGALITRRGPVGSARARGDMPSPLSLRAATA